ncbi:ABC transporter ATP-binding protein [Rhizobium leguminosarum]|uniref:ABC transporter ATP-binding protein n=1 Tax=Rhizobium leguminosarum TaxID=384 RepID=UPI001C97B6E0|nr:ABC transporter ATP-binding protein [Rhizobium leguminosarum]MBY5775363.1 ABC transporter ATP-binding protein [Rhizobium leguminosarum]
MSDIDINLVSVRKTFGDFHAVNDISLAIPKGEFLSLLGPSGCGKTTTLNMIAGFQEPTAGQIQIRGKNQVGVPPERRNIGLVFQNYALFPHMTVAQNVGFGLKMKGVTRMETDQAVQAALRSVHLEGLENRYPKELSGGQQQRTALARAIAPKPSVLLLDEPLSNLDQKLREAMRVELKEIQEKLGMTFVYVTHDQEEAMAMSDRVVVMAKGVIAQEGRPEEIYNNPSTSFVADFIGKSNILPIMRNELGSDRTRVSINGGKLSLKVPDGHSDAKFCCIRPEDVRMVDDANSALVEENVLDGTIVKIVNLGAHLDVWTVVDGDLTLKSQVRSVQAGSIRAGKRVSLSVSPAAIKLLKQ